MSNATDKRAPRDLTITRIAEIIREQSGRPWERCCVLAEDNYDASDTVEKTLLRVLASEPARVFTKQEIHRAVYPRDSFGSTRRIDSAAARLRRRFESGCGARMIVNVWGVGYRLMDATR
jgi:DNA-binding response OmpR family regulator